MVDEVVILSTPTPFWAVGAFYEDFAQVSDDEVATLLARAARVRSEPAAPGPAGGPG
jgi:putative phosphoribosyl transferase